MALLVLPGTALAQLPGVETSSAGVEPACPHGRLSIYYASGEADASPQAEALIGLISDHAARCNADGVDLIARIDTRVDGENALSLALERLGAVAANLAAKGVPVERMRIAAQAAKTPASSSIAEVDVIFRKSSAETPEVAAPAPVQPRLMASDAI